MERTVVIVSCEHAYNAVPKGYAYLFKGKEEVLNSHRGYDIGIQPVAKALAEALECVYYEFPYSRLLIEPNRSLHHPDLFSAYSKDLDNIVKKYLISRYYLPYREYVEEAIIPQIKKKRVVHLSMHSFTPVWQGKERQVDVGILFDDSDEAETRFSLALQSKLQQSLPRYRICLNEPYLGIDDGFTSYLRTKYTTDNYLGVEIEIKNSLIYPKVEISLNQLFNTISSVIKT